MPILCKQIKERIFGRMLRDKGFIERHTKPWSVRQWEATICRIDLDHACDSFLHPGIGKVVEMLLNFEVGCTRRKMESGGRPSRPTHMVGCDEHVIGIR